MPRPVWNRVWVLLALGFGAMAAMAYGPPWNSPNDQACQSSLKRLAVGLLMYCQDYNDRFPPMAGPQPLERRVLPYLKDREVIRCPETGEAYLPNPALNYVGSASVKSPATTLLLRDAKPHRTDPAEPRWHLVNVDGHADVSATEPRMGPLAPDPPPARRLTRGQKLAAQLRALREQRKSIDAAIRRLEAERRKERRR